MGVGDEAFGHLRWWPNSAPASASAKGARLPRPLLRPTQIRRPGPDRIEQRPVAILQDMAFREWRPQLQPKRAQHAVVAVVALQYNANEGRGGPAAAGAEFGGDLVLLRSIELSPRLSRQTREMKQ